MVGSNWSLRTFDGQVYRIGETLPPIECFRCGICCTRFQPRLTVGEVKRLAKRLALTTDDFISRYVEVTKVGYLLRQTKQGCVFLVWEEGETRASCRIYPFRPAACRDWVLSLSRPECREGLGRLKTRHQILLVKELYPSPQARRGFVHLLGRTRKNT